MSMDSMNWFGGIRRKFEAMCSEMDDIMWQEKFQYMENQLQTAGANVKQFCSEFLQEVLPQSFVGVVEGATDDCALGQRIDEANIVEEQSEKDLDEANIVEQQSKKELRSSSVKSVKVEKHDLSLEEDTVNSGITENCSELLEDDSLTKITPHIMPSSDSNNLVHSCGVALPVAGLNPGDDASAESISKFDESCVIVDEKDKPSVSLEAGREGSCKEKIKKVLALRRRASRGSFLQEGEGFAASSNATSNHEIWVSDWEII